MLVLLAACTTTQTATMGTGNGPDGPPPAGSGPDPQQVPDAVPKIEPIVSGGPNKPYEALGRNYTPVTRDEPLAERGLASWYGKRFHGRRTASGELYNMYAMTAAHRTMPIPSYARVRNPVNGREIIVRINDRGPFSKDRVIDLSWTAAVKLGVQGGVSAVEVTRLTNDDIRAGVWPSVSSPPVLAAGSRMERVTPPAAVPPPVLAGMPANTLAPAAVDAAAAADDGPGGDALRAQTLLAASGNPAGNDPPPDPQASNPRLPAELSRLPMPAPGSDAAPLPPNSRTAPTQARSYTTAASGFWLQLGAFSRSEGAMSFHRRVADELGWLAPLLAVFSEGGIHRLQAGPYVSREQAREASERVRSTLQLVPVIVERR
ncbi:septal ring lytic transglycosylase RlpA family protein [Ideonella azotifigens]|uniref:Endolytic peptidoglycan transglycosylase RlpA n=2 Tax=Ideonella azotifigens TaxID=513160 RepID=A0ABN1KBP1_9BURK